MRSYQARAIIPPTHPHPALAARRKMPVGLGAFVGLPLSKPHESTHLPLVWGAKLTSAAASVGAHGAWAGGSARVSHAWAAVNIDLRATANGTGDASVPASHGANRPRTLALALTYAGAGATQPGAPLLDRADRGVGAVVAGLLPAQGILASHLGGQPQTPAGELRVAAAVATGRFPGSGFTAAIEVPLKGEEPLLTLVQRQATRRSVYNVLEDPNAVVGITNYVDLALQMAYRRGEGLALRGGAAWQLNRCWLLKAATGPEATTATLAFKSWHALLNATAALTARVAHSRGARADLGLSVTLENEGDVLYERGPRDRLTGVPTLVSCPPEADRDMVVRRVLECHPTPHLVRRAEAGGDGGGADVRGWHADVL